MSENNDNSANTPPPQRTPIPLSQFSHPDSLQRPQQPSTTLPYTPATPLPSDQIRSTSNSQFETPRTIRVSKPRVPVPITTIHEEDNINSSQLFNSQYATQQPSSPEHKQINNQQQQQQSQLYGNYNSGVIDILHTENEPVDSNGDINNINTNTNYDENNNVQNNTNISIEQQIQQRLFEQKQMFDQTMFLEQQRVQSLAQQVFALQQRSAQLEYERAYYSHQQPPTTTMNTNNNNQQSINSINNNISKAISKPDTFDGTATMIDTWIHSMRNYLLLANIPIEQQVPVAQTYLRGQAANWSVHLSATDKLKCLTLDGWFTQLLTFFRPVDAINTARRQLNALMQRGFDLIKFNSRFNQLVQYFPKMEMEEKIMKYREKLDPKLQTLLVSQQYNDLGEIMKAALHVDQALKLINEPSTNKPNQRFYSRPASTMVPVVNQHVQAHAEHSEEPGSDEEQHVVIQNVHSSTKKKVIPKMNEEIRKWCIANNACFRCRTVGHSSNKCTQFKQRTNNGGTSSSGFTPSAAPSKQHF